MSEATLERIAAILESRKHNAADNSYVAQLYAAGLDKILKKVGEEAAETVIAAKNNDPQAVIHETADLWFHCLVMLASLDLGPQQVLEELESRFGQSGLDEKAARNKAQK